MSDRLSSASERVLRDAIRAAKPGGTTHRYFLKEGHWEAPDRQRFAELVSGTCPDAPEFEPRSLPLLRELNARYNTRHAKRDLPNVNRCVVEALAGFARAHGMNLKLLTSTDAERRAMVHMVREGLTVIRRDGYARPYSLVTKFLHFLMPDTFAIYDSQAAAAIESWRFSAFDPGSPAGFRDSFRFLATTLGNTSGVGYCGVLDFYYLAWQSSSAEVKAEAQGAALALERELRSRHGTDLARFTVLDLIDKYLWKAQAPAERRGQSLEIAV